MFTSIPASIQSSELRVQSSEFILLYIRLEFMLQSAYIIYQTSYLRSQSASPGVQNSEFTFESSYFRVQS